ncbi:hypothetical protein F441_05648 [Phytophthora nicotianae CJ01A1]|uniref:Uncharacterized protein n=2 Tax=Phytophthora nicotianae TaxID=4792 RepID=W2JEQ2_PHYNI|nr:hypothetical protein L915_05500 [Phytophthora nicotianae]ETL44202.1 hypothetical protein L916_05445 [Phytophthora nicotianae]ETP20669.1 hypothetical protein F441_05648 [Phytophthora nicotianae CJ01A1]
MPLMLCSCSCGLHSDERRLHTITAQPSEARDTAAKSVYTQDDVEDEEEGFTLSSRSSGENYEDDVAIEQEEAEAAITTLQLQVRALRKYKSNYELLCGQLSELNTQIGLQLQRHEADVAALQASIADLQTEKIALEAQVLESQQALAVQRDAVKQDREYSDNVHRQLSKAAELLKATEKRLKQQEEHFTAEMERLRTQLANKDNERAKFQGRAKELEEELETLQERENAAKEQEVMRRRREKGKLKKALMAHKAKLRSLSDELEAQRSALRAAKKQLGHVQADNDALRKQLTNVKRDGAHLSDIIDSQRVEHESYTDELMQTKKAKKQLAKRVRALSQDREQLQNELADAKEELVHKNSELESFRDEIKTLRVKLQKTSQALNEVESSNEKLVKQIEKLQKMETERCAKAKTEEQAHLASRDHKYRNELIRMRELLVDNQQRSTESSKDVQKLRRELLSVQKLLHGCNQERHAVDQWAEVLRNSFKAEEVPKSTILEKLRALKTSSNGG